MNAAHLESWLCLTCDVVVNKVSTSDRLDKEKVANVAFVTQSAVAATMDMGVGQGRLVSVLVHGSNAPQHLQHAREGHHAGEQLWL